MAERLSNGDENPVTIQCESLYPIAIQAIMIDEIPIQFQIRDFKKKLQFHTSGSKTITYSVYPVQRGEYRFGRILVYVTNQLGIVTRRYVFNQPVNVPVYPSYIQMQKYQLMAATNRLFEAGIKPVRKIGHHMEFDQIRQYIQGDDYRTINWKATARKAELMVNQFMEEKSQPVYSIIDMGRNMKSPFNGMTLLDYSINATLVFSSIAIHKSDKAGLITFSKNMDSILPATNRSGQMQHIMELLYKQQTNFEEPNYELLYATIRRKITQRSLLLVFTNFESPVSLHRQLKYLSGLAKNHVVVVIFFKNIELYQLTQSEPGSVEEIYIQTIAEKMFFDKTMIQKELSQHGILSVLTTPEQLTPDLINEYLSIKARGIL